MLVIWVSYTLKFRDDFSNPQIPTRLLFRRGLLRMLVSLSPLHPLFALALMLLPNPRALGPFAMPLAPSSHELSHDYSLLISHVCSRAIFSASQKSTISLFLQCPPNPNPNPHKHLQILLPSSNNPPPKNRTPHLRIHTVKRVHNCFYPILVYLCEKLFYSFLCLRGRGICGYGC